jgi:DNA-binding protein
MNQYNEVFDAIRTVSMQGDRWELADALASISNPDYDEIYNEAMEQDVPGAIKYKPTTLRFYRATAIKWPTDQRVDGMTFNAHKVAEVLIDDKQGHTIDTAINMLEKLRDKGGQKVTIMDVRRAVASEQGKKLKEQATSKERSVIDALSDLKQGGKQLKASITGAMSLSDLDALDEGLKKVAQHVLNLRGKAAQKAQGTAAKQSAAPKPTKQTAAAASNGNGNGNGEHKPRKGNVSDLI